jgi:hypothetical protein
MAPREPGRRLVVTERELTQQVARIAPAPSTPTAATSAFGSASRVLHLVRP